MGVAIGGLVLVGLLVEGKLNQKAFTRLAGLLGACVLAAAVTPLGPSLLLSPLTVGANGREFVTEWMPSSVRNPSVTLVLLMLASAWGLWLWQRRRLPVWQLLMWCAAVAFSLSMQRTVPIAAILSALVLAEAAENYLATREGVSVSLNSVKRSARLSWCLAAVLAAAVAVPLADARGRHASAVPQAFAPHLAELEEGTRVISFGDLTGWLMFTAPQVEPVFDLRIEQYSPAHVRAYIDTMQAERGWKAFLQETSAHTAILEDDSPLSAALMESRNWQVVARDGGFILLQKHS
jgi:hypothetical protein